MRMKNVHRNGITAEQLALPLEQAWMHKTKRPPMPAWTESPAKHNYLANTYNLKPRQNFDRCFDVAVAGSRVYFGSSAGGTVTCLDAGGGGKKLWTFFTDGPIRFAPHVTNDRVYFGSDDGYVYCLNAADASIVWKERAGPSGEKIWGNEHMISVWPVRTSVMVDGEDVYWTAGLFPHEGMFLCKRKAADGSGGWTKTPVRPHQGYLAATADSFFAPSGKSFTAVYKRDNGKHAGDLKKTARDGGCWALVTPDESEVWAGPTVENKAQQFKSSGKTYIASIGGANCLVAEATGVFYNTDTKIIRLNRKDRAAVWSCDLAYPFALIKAGDHLFAGGDGEVAAIDAANGKLLWKHALDGRAYGLAVANGALYVSTDKGSIYCFGKPKTP
ncbi:MAG: PQQ-binding-like beta-propeller repeat protein, partial [Pirellulales bacterium]|nr:PQQ-binding-like beta-propeller repeat protein [Pirellulales bacterium]